jgi:hypothetical protein
MNTSILIASSGDEKVTESVFVAQEQINRDVIAIIIIDILTIFSFFKF